VYARNWLKCRRRYLQNKSHSLFPAGQVLPFKAYLTTCTMLRTLHGTQDHSAHRFTVCSCKQRLSSFESYNTETRSPEGRDPSGSTQPWKLQQQHLHRRNALLEHGSLRRHSFISSHSISSISDIQVIAR